jgi:pentatricopeptide repeat protein
MKVKLKLRHAADLLYSRGSATSEAYTRLVLECVRANQAQRLQHHMELHFLQPDNSFVQNRLLHLYAKSGKLLDARNLFDRMLKGTFSHRMLANCMRMRRRGRSWICGRILVKCVDYTFVIYASNVFQCRVSF